MEQVKLLSTTIVLTLLIWVGADQLLTITTTVNVALSVAPASPDSKMIVRVADASPQRFAVKVSGPRRIVTQVEDAAPIEVTLPVGEREPSDRTTLGNLVELLRRQRRAFKDLTIESVEPPTMDIVVDQWTIARVALVIKGPPQLAYKVPPQLEPAYIAVRMSLLRFRRMGSQARQIEIDVDSSLEGKPKDQPLSIKLPIPISKFGEGASAAPNTVRVVATLSVASPRRMTIPTVPIRLAPGFAAFGRYGVELQGGQSFVTQTIEVTGADDALDRLDPNNTEIIGVIPLAKPDYEHLGRLLVKAPVFLLPPGIILVGDPEPVQFKLVAIESNR